MNTDGRWAAGQPIIRTLGIPLLAGALALLAAMLMAPAALAVNAGDLDAGFSFDGRVRTDIGSGKEAVRGVAIQDDGKIVAAGVFGTYEFAVARYNPDGSPDPGFSGDGKVITDFGGRDLGEAVAIQDDGKIVVAGASDDLDGVNDGDFAVARYNPNGSLDTSFSGDGKVVTSFGRSEHGYAVTIQDDGKIVVAGSKYANDGPFDRDADFAIARYNPNGSLDTSFDGDGRATAGLGEFDTAYGVALQADGRIVLAGESDDFDGDSDLALARYNRDGSLDSSFDGDGKLTTGLGADDHAFAVAIQDGFYPVVAGRSDVGGEYDFALARYNPDGSLDSTFAGDGKLTAGIGGIDSAEDVAIQPDGRIVAAGWSSHSGDVDFALARFTPSGAFDSSFSGNGKLLTDFFGQDDAALAVAIQPNGRIVAAGTSGTIDRPELGILSASASRSPAITASPTTLPPAPSSTPVHPAPRPTPPRPSASTRPRRDRRSSALPTAAAS